VHARALPQLCAARKVRFDTWRSGPKTPTTRSTPRSRR
jgi:hypothetical protein